MPRLQVHYVSATSIGLFEQTSPHYGEIWYDLGGRRADEPDRRRPRACSRRSTRSPASRRRARTSDEVFRGHPLAVPPQRAAAVFYGIWPALVVAGGILHQEEAFMNGRHDGRLIVLAAGVLRRAARRRPTIEGRSEQGDCRQAAGRRSSRWSARGSSPQDGDDKVDHGRRPAVGRQQGQPDEAPHRERPQALRHVERRADGQREAVRLLPGRACSRASTTSRTARISVKFKTVAGDSDRASGILFNVKPNGDWLAVRYNDTENNVALWEFHNGIRRVGEAQRPREADARSRGVARAEADGRRRQPHGVDRRRAGARVHRSAARPAPAATARRRIRICFPRTTRSCARRSAAGSASGRRPTAPAISRTTSSAPSRSTW